MLEDGLIDWQRSHAVDTRLARPVAHNNGARQSGALNLQPRRYACTRQFTTGAAVLEAQYAWEYTPEGAAHVAFFGTVR
jgi:hypothetical protein